MSYVVLGLTSYKYKQSNTLDIIRHVIVNITSCPASIVSALAMARRH